MHDLIREHARALAGHATQAEILLRQAAEIFRRSGAAEAGSVARELAALAEAGPPA
jgi:hypothetical protein